MSAPHLMPPPSGMWRGDMMDYMTDARSMASLMSYSLGEGHCSGVFLYETHFSVMSSLHCNMTCEKASKEYCLDCLSFEMQQNVSFEITLKIEQKWS